MFHESFKEVEVSRIFHDFQRCSKSVSKVFQGSSRKTFKVFQKSFMLHGTHHSFPSIGLVKGDPVESIQLLPSEILSS